MLTVEALNGPAALPYMGDLAALRIEVFREFPYLYEGTLEYEQRYLKSYAEHARSVTVPVASFTVTSENLTVPV